MAHFTITRYLYPYIFIVTLHIFLNFPTNNFSLSLSLFTAFPLSFSPRSPFHPTRTRTRAKAEVDRLAPYNHDIFHPPDRCSVLRKIGSYQNIVVTVRCRVFQIAAVPSMHSWNRTRHQTAISRWYKYREQYCKRECKYRAQSMQVVSPSSEKLRGCYVNAIA